jgi:aminoglycoside N3'-acetyltransferase
MLPSQIPELEDGDIKGTRWGYFVEKVDAGSDKPLYILNNALCALLQRSTGRDDWADAPHEQWSAALRATLPEAPPFASASEFIDALTASGHLLGTERMRDLVRRGATRCIECWSRDAFVVTCDAVKWNPTYDGVDAIAAILYLLIAWTPFVNQAADMRMAVRAFGSQLVDASSLVRDFRALGLTHGNVVMVHASMRKVGPVIGGAAAVLDALVEVIGPGGTILMVLSADEDEPFDALQSPVDVEEMGILAEVFRTRAGVLVNDHAADRFAALGPKAPYLLNPTPLHDYHGPGSVLERLVAADGLVLRLGANPDTVTLTHYAEYLADVPNKIRVKRRYVRADIGEQWIESLDDTDGIAQWAHGDYFPQILIDFVQAGHARIGPVGNCRAELLRAQPFVHFAVDWMNRHLAPLPL